MSSKEQRAAQDKAQLERTLSRLEAVRNHTDNTQGTNRLGGKVCIITGCGMPKGIGRATANLFAREGVKALILADLGGDLDELKSYLTSKYPKVAVVTAKGDASDEEFVESLCERAVQDFGQLDVFFANAGISSYQLWAESVEKDDFMATVRINTLSCMLAIKHSVPRMKITSGTKKDAAGSIVMTASVAGMRAGAGPIDYSVSKAGVISLAQTTAMSLAGQNIRVNGICPGLIETNMVDMIFEGAKAKGRLGSVGQLNPTLRYGIPPEVAHLVLFLASDDASYVNGAAIPVDGGLTAQVPFVPGKQF